MTDLDKAGVAFDPAVHYVKDGHGVLTKASLWRMRGGAPKKEAAPEVPNSVLARLEALESALRKKDEEIAALKAAPSGLLDAEMQSAVRALAGRTVPAWMPPGPAPKHIPYKGAVRALTDCHVGQYYKAGEIFHVEVPVLWSDDPYVPVTVTGYNDKGEVQTEPNPLAPPTVDFRFRPRSHEAIARMDAEPRRASEF